MKSDREVTIIEVDGLYAPTPESPRSDAERFRTIMKAASELRRPARLGLVRLLGRVVQAGGLSRWYTHAGGSGAAEDDLLFPLHTVVTVDGKTARDLLRESRVRKSVSLGSDIVLAGPWKPQRIAGTLDRLGPGGREEPWRQQRDHLAVLWKPMMVTLVYDGNHSIAAGIAYGKGEVRPVIAYDLSDLYDYVGCDGMSYFRSHDGSEISPIRNLEMAAIFEIGRTLRRKRFSKQVV